MMCDTDDTLGCGGFIYRKLRYSDVVVIAKADEEIFQKKGERTKSLQASKFKSGEERKTDL